MRILTLFVRHGTAKYPDALSELLSFQRKRLPSVRHELLIIDNASSPRRTDDGGARVIAGSNRQWEFSAWDEGLAHVGQRIWDFDLLHLVTSAHRTLYTRYIDRFDVRMLEEVAGRGAAVGHIDRYNEPVGLLGYTAQAWLRSAFLFIPPAEVATLASLVGVPEPGGFFSDDPAQPFCADAPLSQNHRRYILDWLTGPGTGQGVLWHSRFVLNRETLPYFRAKVLAMLNEQMLSIRLRRQACSLVDATWLATRLSGASRARVTAFPPWHIQLAERDTDPVTLAPER